LTVPEPPAVEKENETEPSQKSSTVGGPSAGGSAGKGGIGSGKKLPSWLKGLSKK
jgi:hypothetical protein